MDEVKKTEVLELETSTPQVSRESSREPALTLWQAARKWPKVLGYTLGLTSAILLYGFDTSIVGNVSAIPVFQRDYGRQLGDRYIVPSMWMGLWNAVTPLGIMVGAVIAGWLQDRVGRRWSLSISSLASAVGVAMIYTSHLLDDVESRRGQFLAGKLFQGVAIGSLLCTTQTYMSEVLPPSLRGSVLAFFPVFTLLGQLAGAVTVFTSLSLPGQRPYTVPMLAQWPFSAVPCIWAIFLPESPVYLLRKKKFDAAFKAQKRLDTKNMDTQANIDTLKAFLQAEEDRSTFNRSTYKECFVGVNRKRTLIVILANNLPQIGGLLLLSDASYFIQMVGMSAKNALLFLQLGIGLGLLANIVSMYLLSRIGRRPLILTTFAIAALLWTGMGIAGIWDGIIPMWYTAVTMMVTVVVIGVGLWPASYAVSAETSSLRLRAKTQGIGWFCGGLGSGIFAIALPYTYNKDGGDLRGKAGFIFTFFCLLGLFLCWMFVPEMKNRTAAEIDIMFEERLPTREFKNWSEPLQIERIVTVDSTASEAHLIRPQRDA